MFEAKIYFGINFCIGGANPLPTRKLLSIGSEEGMEINKELVTKEFIVTEKEMQEKLGITGSIQSIVQFKGLSMKDEEEGKSTLSCEWLITTVEIKNQLVR